jgi:hypothetical protein
VTTDTAAAIIAVFAPLIVSLVKQAGWPSSVNGFVAVACYLVFGGLAVVLSGQSLTVDNFVPLAGIFTTIGTAAYYAFWQHTGLEAALTTSTSVVKAPAA